ncbi:hypothetical protein P9112_003970 [Eukaryota sp. TZLM1-RC]
MSTPSGVNLSYRKKWDSSQLASTSSSRDSKDKGLRVLPMVKDTLKPHRELNLDQHVGQRTIDKDTAGGVSYYRCEVCDVGFHDSIAYLDHLNGQKHQRRLGRKMVVEKSQAADILEILGMSGEEEVQPKTNRLALLQKELEKKKEKDIK